MSNWQQQQQPPPPPQQQQQQWGGQQPPQDYYNQGQDQNGYQQYGQPPPYSYNPPKESDPNYSFDQAFKIEKPKYNDIWAGILMILFFAGFVAVFVITIRRYITGSHGGGVYGGTNNFSLNNNTIILFGLGLALAFLLSWAYLTLARLLPKAFIWITGILNVALTIGTAIFYLYKKYWSAGIVFLVFGLFTAFAFWTWIPRIPFSALMLRTTIDVSKKHGHVYIVSLIGGVIAIAFSAWFSVTLTAIYVSYEPSPDNPHCQPGGKSCSKAKVIGLIVFVSFTMYWILEWLKNTIHTTVAGLYASWYFSPVGQFPKGATRGSARRALTYSFGSISLGSLVIAIIQFLRQLCSVARQQSMDDGGLLGMAGYVLFCILGCLISLLEWAVQFINKYAFCHIALYGKSYFHAAKDTWHLIKDRGIDALVNDCLIGPVLSFGAMFIGAVTALFAYLYLIFTDPGYNKDGSYTPVIIAFAFLMAFQIGLIFTTPISSGVDTIFVAAGWDPQVMISNHGELYREMVSLYPKAQQAISVR
ncbi:putative choline transporter, neither null mutation nor overexpression affects choline transport [Claviceps capensis]|nr:putative choline transporter, neither null mutation nor overexpression affects choline transport [Claviceps capensis]